MSVRFHDTQDPDEKARLHAVIANVRHQMARNGVENNFSTLPVDRLSDVINNDTILLCSLSLCYFS